MAQSNTLILNEIEINKRLDGYVNATAMCKAGKKQFKHFLELDRTRSFLHVLSTSVGKTTDLLVQKTVTGKNEERGTYIHPQAAISLAMWISPDFEVAVTNWIMNGIMTHNPAVIQAYISPYVRQWEKTIPDAVWLEFGRLTGVKDPIHGRPQYWGYLVKELIYDTLDPEVSAYLKTNKPPVGVKWHQNLTENFGVKVLVSRCYEIVGMAKACMNIEQLKYMVAKYYTQERLQLCMEFRTQ